MIHFFHLEKLAILRAATRQFLQNDTSIYYAGEADNASDLEERLRGMSIDVMLLDIEICPDCPELCRQLLTMHPGLQIILHTPYKYIGRIHNYLEAGVKGFLSKNSGFEELQIAIHKVYSNKRYICPILSEGFRDIHKFFEEKTPVIVHGSHGLTKREEEVLTLVARGYSTKTIAKKLWLTEKTIETHRRNMLEKIRVKNTAELIYFAAHVGLVVNEFQGNPR